MKRNISLLFLALALFACNQTVNKHQVSDRTTNEKSSNIIAADNQFGFELFKKVNASLGEPKNTMISPLSVSLALAMVYNGTAGNTKLQMKQMLHKVGMAPKDLNQSYKDLLDSLTSRDTKVNLSISNAIFYRNTYSIKKKFITTNQNYYQAEIQGLDFTNSAEALKTINGWVNTKTKGKINQIIEEVEPEDKMVLLNAIYFKGEWKDPFDSTQTMNSAFTKEDKIVVQVPTMSKHNHFKQYTDESFQMLEMPYGSGKYSMLVLLPDAGKTADDVIALLTPDHMINWVSKLNEQDMIVNLPKFKFAFEESLGDELIGLGMTDAFNDNANLSGISEVSHLSISDVMHKTFIIVDERGTKATAVTLIRPTDSIPQPPISFKADHPFVFVIREKDSQAILFIGKVMNPLQH